MAFSFNGSSQYISCSIVLNSYPLSFSCIAKSTDLTAFQQVMTLGNTNTSMGRFLRLAYDGANLFGTDNAISMGCDYNALADQIDNINSTTTYQNDVYEHLSCVFESAISRFVYLNAGGKKSSSVSVGFPSINILGIAAWVRSNVVLYLKGNASEIAVWSAALTDDEIASLAKGFKPTRIRPQSLVFYAPLLRNLQDLKGGLALTNNNGATVADHPRVY